METGLTLTREMIVVLGLMGFTIAMFMFERLRADVTAFVVLIALGLFGLVAPDELFSGFSGNATICVIATMILSAGLDRTGALNRLAAWILRRSKGDEERMVGIASLVSGVVSSTMQNPSVVTLFLPVASRLSARTGVALGRLLMPIAAAVVMGGCLTMVGSSPLILLNDLMASANRNLPSGVATLHSFNMFAPFPIGVALLLLSLAYFRWYGGKRLLGSDEKNVTPARTESYFASAYGIQGDVFELTVTADSPLVGMSIGEAEAQSGAPLFLALQTGNDARLSPPADQMIWVGSVIGALGPREQVEDYAKQNGLRLSARLRRFADLFDPNRAGISEAVIPPTSTFIGHAQAELRLRKRYGISLLAINRDRHVYREDIRQLPLKAGDMLVLHSDWQDLTQAAKDKNFVVVTDYPKGEQRPHKFRLAMAIFALALTLALTAELPATLALMAGAAGMLITGVLNMDEAYGAINWKTVFVMACLLPLGWAMDSTGTAAWLAQQALEILPDAVPIFVLQLLVALLATGFSLVISQVGATVVTVPMAINIAVAAGADPAAFALIAALSASNNFVTLSNPVLPIITGPAGYTVKDLWRIGGPLSLAYLLVVLVMANLLIWWQRFSFSSLWQ
ncbi:SLC13 family permease [Arenimonas sp.]|uniref:SLC13 family permease n=1 Tax=Arenimonas sp. TaxID=1872635 RepID=UPI0039E67EE6